MPDAVKCNCRHPECTTCNPPDPDPTAAELARMVAWLRARCSKCRDAAHEADKSEYEELSEFWDTKADALRDAADDLERGEQP